MTPQGPAHKVGKLDEPCRFRVCEQRDVREIVKDPDLAGDLLPIGSPLLDATLHVLCRGLRAGPTP